MKPTAITPNINKTMGLAGLLLAALLPVSQAHANLVNNGSFEDGNVGFATSYDHPRRALSAARVNIRSTAIPKSPTAGLPVLRRKTTH